MFGSDDRVVLSIASSILNVKARIHGASRLIVRLLCVQAYRTTEGDADFGTVVGRILESQLTKSLTK